MARASDRRRRSALGTCPNCDFAIPPGYELIKYETSEGHHRRYVECPECRDVVHPQ